MADKDVKYKFTTTADTSGAKATEEAVKAVGEQVAKNQQATKAAGDEVVKTQVRIIDTTKKSTEEIERNKKEFKEWQDTLNANRKNNGGSALAVDPEEMNRAKQAADEMGDEIVKSAQAAEGSLEQLEGEVKKLEQQLRRIPVGSQAFADMAAKVDAAKTALNNARATALTQFVNQQYNAERGGRQFGNVLQNVGYQAADVAVQLEMGTSAARAFTQQGSQMLAVLGPWGAIAGAALAIGGAIFAASNKTKEAAESTDDLTDAYKNLQEAAAEAEKELELAKISAVNEAYETRAQRIDDILRKLKDELKLQKELRDIELERQDAEAAFAIKLIESSDIDEIQKVEQIAMIRNEMAKRQAENEKAKIESDKLEVAAAVKAAEINKADAQTSVDENTNRAAARKEALKAVEQEIKKRQELQARIFENEKERSEAKARYDASTFDISDSGIDTRTDEEIAKAAADFKRAQELEEQIKKDKAALSESDQSILSKAREGKSGLEASKITDAGKVLDEERKIASEYAQEITGALSTAEEKLREATEELAKARAEEALKLRELDAKKSLVDTKAGIAIAATQVDVTRDRKDIETRRSQEAEKERRKVEAEQKRIEAEEKRRESAASSKDRTTASIGRSALGMLPKGLNPEVQKQADEIVAKLQDGDQGGEIKALMKLMNDIMTAVQKRTGKTDINFKHLEARVRELEGK